MKLPALLFGLLLLMGAAFVGICFVEQSPQEQGFDHPAFPAGTMRQAPDGYQRHRPVVAVAGGFGALVALFVGASLPLGLNPQHRGGFAARLLLTAAGVYAALLMLVVICYWNGIQSPQAFVLGFPLSTAVMMFLLAPAPLLLVVLYAVRFRQWIMTAEDEAKFHELVARRRKQRDN